MDNDMKKLDDENKQKKSSPENKNKKDNNKKDNKKGEGSILKFFIIAFVSTFMFNILLSSSFTNRNIEIRYDEFVDMLEADYIEEVEIQYDRLIITPKDNALQKIEEDIIQKDETGYVHSIITGNSNSETEENSEDSQEDSDEVVITGTDKKTPEQVREEIKDLPKDEQVDAMLQYYMLERKKMKGTTKFYTGRLPDDGLIDRLEQNEVKYSAKVIDNNPFLSFIVEWVLPLVFIYAILAVIMFFLSKKMGGGGIMSAGKTSAKLYNKEDKTGITFEDVAGQEEAKESLQEIVDFLHKPEKYREIGAKQPKGALLVGPPGTGKTLLAKAVAGESNAAFLSLTGSEFIEMYVGVGASRVRDLFKLAKKNSPCIVFIDEIDAIGKSRDGHQSGNDEREQTLNQLLSEMDGFDSKSAIVVIAATNRPEILDKALLRPGRFDRQVTVEKPDLKGRQDILEVHLKKVKFQKNINRKRMALATAGATGADIANMVNEAALRAVRQGRKEVSEEDLLESVEVVIAGKEKKDRIMSQRERRIVSYHEVGHALTAALQKNTQPIQKITIVPRTMGSLGYTLQMPDEEKFLSSREELLSEIVVFLGGRAAEDLVFDVATTGASNDIERSTDIARRMITMYGMSDKFQMMGIESVQNRYLDGRRVTNCADSTMASVDEEVRKLMSECYDKAKSLLEEYRDALDEISEYLLERENITGMEFMQILKKYKPDLKINEETKQISIDELFDEKEKVEQQEAIVFDVVLDDSENMSNITDNFVEKVPENSEQNKDIDNKKLNIDIAVEGSNSENNN